MSNYEVDIKVAVHMAGDFVKRSVIYPKVNWVLKYSEVPPDNWTEKFTQILYSENTELHPVSGSSTIVRLLFSSHTSKSDVISLVNKAAKETNSWVHIDMEKQK